MTGNLSAACQYREHNSCGSIGGAGIGENSCACLCHNNHCCRDCGRILGQGAPWQRCVPCEKQHKFEATLRAQHRRIEAVLEEEFLIEAKDAHRRIMALIG